MLNRTTTPCAAGSIAMADAACAGSRARPWFTSLVRSPSRAGLLRCLGTRPFGSSDVARGHACRLLDALNWNRKRAAEVRRVSRGTLYRKLSEFGLVAEPRA